MAAWPPKPNVWQPITSAAPAQSRLSQPVCTPVIPHHPVVQIGAASGNCCSGAVPFATGYYYRPHLRSPELKYLSTKQSQGIPDSARIGSLTSLPQTCSLLFLFETYHQTCTVARKLLRPKSPGFPARILATKQERDASLAANHKYLAPSNKTEVAGAATKRQVAIEGPTRKLPSTEHCSPRSRLWHCSQELLQRNAATATFDGVEQENIA